ncbi:MAG: putative recombinase [Evtepia sp.]|jgi:DNA invertase Pin-like site-specific DNA recombinase|nr:putative recombinase [Evtepia sp.]
MKRDHFMAQSENLPPSDQYLIYLRKSRKDRDTENETGITDTLQRHRDTLLSIAKSNSYGIAHIYEEVVSGDTIAERPEMQKLLAAVETGIYTGVLVMEVPRLARGNTRDQGIVAETFQYSGTKIITPERIYDPTNESDEEYFEFGLFMSRREYKSINRRQQRGRLASLNEGKYIAGTAPFGYERVKIPKQKGWTLQIVPERAEIVRLIFDLYTIGEMQEDGTRRKYGAYTIANLLNERKVASPSGKRWSSSAVKGMLSNPTYAGYIRWGSRPIEKRMHDGIVIETRPLKKDARLLDGLHEPIISREIWKESCDLRKSRSHTPVPAHTKLSNPLAGLLYCSVCGHSLVGLPQRKGSREWLLIKCPSAKCPSVGAPLQKIEAGLMEALHTWLENYSTDSASFTTPEQTNLVVHEKELSRLSNELATIKAQQNTLYDLLEQGIYDKELFRVRSRDLAVRSSEISNAICKTEMRISNERIAQENQETLTPNVEKVLDAYDSLTSPAAKNSLLKEVLDKVIYYKSIGGRWAKSDMKLYLFPKLQTIAHDR